MPISNAWQIAARETANFLTAPPPPPLWTPFPGPQTTAYKHPADELFFGGAAGGGKTDLLLGLALTSHRRSIIYRRETKQFGAIVDRSREILAGKDWHYNANEHVWRSGDGRVLEFGGAQHEWDWTKQQGHPFDLIAWDELPHFTRLQYRVLNGWNRTSDPKQRCRIVATGNPPTTPEGRWVVEEFAPWLDSEFPNPAQPAELRWYAVIDEKLTWLDSGEEIVHKQERIKPRSRSFIPARVTDNPIYMKTDYLSTLQSLPEPIRSQFLYGDFNAGQEDDPWQVIPTAWVRAAMDRWTEKPPPGVEQTALGVDVARGGRDKTVIAARHGSWFAPLKKFEGRLTPDGPSVATLVIKAHQGKARINIDVVGVGSSAYDYLKEQSWLTTVPINNAEAKSIAHVRDRSGKLRFANVRAASYWKLREALDPDGPDRLALPPDNELLADLCAPHYKVQSSGIVVEKKEDIAARLGRSPDCSDALVMANWCPQRVTPILRTFRFGNSSKNKMQKVMVCSEAELAHVNLDQPAVLVSITDPEPAGKTELPSHGLEKVVGSVVLRFTDMDPADFQSTWNEPIPPYGKPVEQLVLSREMGKKFWSTVLRRRDPVPAVFVIQDSGPEDRRALSLALAMCDALGLPRSGTIFRPSDSEWRASKVDAAPNPYVFRTCKATRHMVV